MANKAEESGASGKTAKKAAKKTGARKSTTKKSTAKKAAKKTTAKKASRKPASADAATAKASAPPGGRLRVRQIRSTARRQKTFKRTLEAIGIRHHQGEVVVTDNAAMRGQLAKVRHLVQVTPEE